MATALSRKKWKKCSFHQSNYNTFSHTPVNQTLCPSINSPLARPTCGHPPSVVAHHCITPSSFKSISTHRTNTFHISPMVTLRKSSTFQSTFSDALRVYKKRIKIDLLSHPLAVRLQPCDSPHAVITVLQKQAGAIDLTLLQRIVDVIYALSLTLKDVNLVNIGACSFKSYPAPSFFRYYLQRTLFLLVSVSSWTSL